MSDAAVGGFVMSLIFGFLGFVLGAWLLRVIMLRHIERQLAAILKELRTRTTAVVIVGMLLLSVACASTYHAKKSKSGDGYAETMIAADTYLVSFTATENTPKPPDNPTAYDARELTVQGFGNTFDQHARSRRGEFLTRGSGYWSRGRRSRRRRAAIELGRELADVASVRMR